MLSEVTKEPSCGFDVIQSFTKQNIDSSKEKKLEINCDNIWRQALGFYKLALAEKSILYRKLRVECVNETSVDVGALSVEYFTKLFEIAKTELFELVPTETFSFETFSF